MPSVPIPSDVEVAVMTAFVAVKSMIVAPVPIIVPPDDTPTDPAGNPVIPDPSPIKLAAVRAPDTLTPPETVAFVAVSNPTVAPLVTETSVNEPVVAVAIPLVKRTLLFVLTALPIRA